MNTGSMLAGALKALQSNKSRNKSSRSRNERERSKVRNQTARSSFMEALQRRVDSGTANTYANRGLVPPPPESNRASRRNEEMSRRFQERMEARSRDIASRNRASEFRAMTERKNLDARAALLRERFGNRNEDVRNTNRRVFRSSRPPIPRGRMLNLFGMQIRPEQI